MNNKKNIINFKEKIKKISKFIGILIALITIIITFNQLREMKIQTKIFNNGLNAGFYTKNNHDSFTILSTGEDISDYDIKNFISRTTVTDLDTIVPYESLDGCKTETINLENFLLIENNDYIKDTENDGKKLYTFSFPEYKDIEKKLKERGVKFLAYPHTSQIESVINIEYTNAKTHKKGNYYLEVIVNTGGNSFFIFYNSDINQIEKNSFDRFVTNNKELRSIVCDCYFEYRP